MQANIQYIWQILYLYMASVKVSMQCQLIVAVGSSVWIMLIANLNNDETISKSIGQPYLLMRSLCRLGDNTIAIC